MFEPWPDDASADFTLQRALLQRSAEDGPGTWTDRGPQRGVPGRELPAASLVQAAARTRPLLSNHAKYAAAETSYVRQNSGHQVGTPGLDMTAAWVRSRMP